MVMMQYRHATAVQTGVVIPGTIAVDANDAAISFTDYIGTLTQDATKSRITRPIVDGQGYEHAAPGARARFKVTITDRSQIVVLLDYTGLVTRNDLYNPVGSIFVDGVYFQDFTNSAAWTSGTAHPVASVEVSVVLNPGTHTVEVIFPYNAAVDFAGLRMPVGGTLAAAPARVSKKIVFFGDSITHGFNSTKMRLHWPFLVAEAESAQMLNLGYGGRGLNPADATAAAASGADIGVSLIGFNNFYPGTTSTATFQSNDELLQANWYAGAAGKPLYIMTPTYSTSDVGEGGAYDGVTPTLEQFRQARRDAVTARADATTTLIEGASGGMPTGVANFPDGIHPDDDASAIISSVVSAAIT